MGYKKKLKAIINSDKTPLMDIDIFLKYFPELKESKDEKIRRAIIAHIKSLKYYDTYYDVTPDEMIAWLEKQAPKTQGKTALEAIHEEKVDNANKVEPKFKVGDWITNGYRTYKITFIDSRYWYSEIRVLGDVDSIDKKYHLWSIQDAKDGDVLWHSDTASNGIFIFKEIRHDGKVLCYCDYDSEDHFCTGEYHTCCWSHDKYVKPATKEQRDLLFQKMHEAGYEWDFDKKELKEIEQ